MQQLEHFLERFIFASRWLLAPFYLGLVGAIALLLFKFIKEFANLLPVVVSGEGNQVMVGVLTLVDVALVANLLIIIVFAGYENFVSKIDTGDHEDRPDWMGHVSFTDLKIKVIGSIVAISVNCSRLSSTSRPIPINNWPGKSACTWPLSFRVCCSR